MLCPPHPPAPLVQSWIERHRDPRSFLLHVLGVPPVLISVLLFPICLALFSLPVFLLCVGLFVGGYGLQFLGHAFDGTEPGEWVALKRGVTRLVGGLAAAGKSRRRVA
ncbi:MAG TPA: Mpo1-like protein [Isosphaeraceae bacterium]|nr:Mpo1-like protein [Isosphaeraceae bacterium]